MTIGYLRAASRRVARFARAASSEAGTGGRKPMINFNAKSREHGLESGKPHPCAPADIVKDFASFGKRPVKKPSSQSSTSSTSSTSASKTSSSPAPQKTTASDSKLPKVDYEDIFDLPARYRQRPPLEEAEMEAVMSGGASLLR